MSTEITDINGDSHRTALPTPVLPSNLSFGFRGFSNWLPLLVLPALVLTLQNSMPAWLFMWAMALAIFTGCKWLTWRKACRNSLKPSRKLSLAYLFLWPGMNATEFLGMATPQNRASVLECSCALRLSIKAGAKLCLGALLLAIAVKEATHWHPLIVGWVAMFGIVLVLHFGIFELVSIAWRRAGINVQPLMQAPLHSRSLAEFWGKRWNTAFSNLAHEFAFRPLSRRFGPSVATLAVFAISGLIHEAVISLPARAGYGLPTAYFLLQGCGVLLERSRQGRHIGLGSGLRGQLFALAVTAIPAFWLFHPPFIHSVILPMLQFLQLKCL